MFSRRMTHSLPADPSKEILFMFSVRLLTSEAIVLEVVVSRSDMLLLRHTALWVLLLHRRTE